MITVRDVEVMRPEFERFGLRVDFFDFGSGGTAGTHVVIWADENSSVLIASAKHSPEYLRGWLAGWRVGGIGALKTEAAHV